MKYQIYLNAKTSKAINTMAESVNQKPNTFIKQTLENIIESALKNYDLEVDNEHTGK